MADDISSIINTGVGAGVALGVTGMALNMTKNLTRYAKVKGNRHIRHTVRYATKGVKK